ncbi:MAG: hypothetical protein QOH83_239 [Solirubrobacteraceae bacterium]|nr:hypothetical protein [Solirubrobacteraceae bacterium]
MMLRMALTQARGCGRRWWPAIDSPTPLIGLRDHAHLVAPTMVGIDCTDCRRPGVAKRIGVRTVGDKGGVRLSRANAAAYVL